MSAKQELLHPGPSDVALGNLDAEVVVVEYHSVTCPHCAYFNANTMPRIMERYVNSGQVLYIAREYPVDAQSFDATLMMRCMPKEKVPAFRAVLFSTQKDWWGKKQYMDMFKTYISLGGMDVDNVMACTQDGALRDRVLQDKLNAMRQLDVVNIPTFFINGRKHEGARPWEYWDAALSSAVRDARAIEEAKKPGGGKGLDGSAVVARSVDGSGSGGAAPVVAGGEQLSLGVKADDKVVTAGEARSE